MRVLAFTLGPLVIVAAPAFSQSQGVIEECARALKSGTVPCPEVSVTRIDKERVQTGIKTLRSVPRGSFDPTLEPYLYAPYFSVCHNSFSCVPCGPAAFAVVLP